MPLPRTDEEVLKMHSIPSKNGCILWMGHRDKDGYPKVHRNSKRFGRISLAHRLAYLLKYGYIPPELEIDHVCKTPFCINPGHLEAVTHTENIKRGDYTKNHRNTKKTHCKHGHPFSGGNLIMASWNGKQVRVCRACRKNKGERAYCRRKMKEGHR